MSFYSLGNQLKQYIMIKLGLIWSQLQSMLGNQQSFVIFRPKHKPRPIPWMKDIFLDMNNLHVNHYLTSFINKF